MNTIRTEAREWIKDPNHTITWYASDTHFREELDNDPHYCPAEDIDIINGFYAPGVERVEIVALDDNPNESASFAITLSRDISFDAALNLVMVLLELRPDAYAGWKWKGEGEDARRVINVSFRGTYEI